MKKSVFAQDIKNKNKKNPTLSCTRAKESTEATIADLHVADGMVGFGANTSFSLEKTIKNQTSYANTPYGRRSNTFD
jgi:hypothetical protein